MPDNISTTANISPQRRTEITELALEVFAEHCDKPPADPLKVFTEHGVSFSFGHYGDAFDGLLEFLSGEFHVYCNIDRDNIPGSPRARFTLAHELGHFLLDDHRNALMSGRVKPHPSKDTATTSELLPEREADLFAASFLMPSHILRQNVARAASGYARIKQLSQIFDVSLQCAAIRYVEAAADPAAIIFWSPTGYAWKRVSSMLWALGCRKSVEDIKAVPIDSATGQLIAARRDHRQTEVVDGHSTLEAWFPNISRSVIRELIVREHAINVHRFGMITLIEPVNWPRTAIQTDVAAIIDALACWGSN
jgi:IrrE N-terminal-like domain